jgi:hypothetical protein
MRYIILFVIVVVVLSCTKEDANLVNPPPPYQSIRIRLLNTVNSSDLISWGQKGNEISDKVGYLQISNPVMPPPIDSFAVEFFQNGVLKYTTPRKIRFVRETRYLFVAAESFKSNGIVDTFVVLSTTYGLPKKLGKSYFKFLNLVKDSVSRFSIVEGCPNGRILVGSVPYLNYPFLQTVQYGSYVISLVQESPSERSLVNIYKVDFEKDKEYTLFVARKQDGSTGLFLYDDYDTTASALQELRPLDERASFVRVLNFSQNPVSVFKSPDLFLDRNIKPNFVSDYYSVPACQNDVLDSFVVETGLGTYGISYSLEIFKRYSLLVFDNQSKSCVYFVPPISSIYKFSGKSIVRVFNAVDTNYSLTLSVGARSANNARGFTSGEVLATNLMFGKVGEPVVLESGDLPLTLFSSTEPAVLQGTFVTKLEPNSSYLLVIFKKYDGSLAISLVPDDYENGGISEISAGYFIQIVNANPDFANLEFEVSNILKNAKLFYKESFATVVNSNFNEIIINNQKFPLNVNLDNLGLYVVAGNNDNIEIFDISRPSMGRDLGSYRRRFFNAVKTYPAISINYDSTNGMNIVKGLAYGGQSGIETIKLERKFSLAVMSEPDGQLLGRYNDIFLTFGKNYTLIFSGRKEKGFSLIIIQEY